MNDRHHQIVFAALIDRRHWTEILNLARHTYIDVYVPHQLHPKNTDTAQYHSQQAWTQHQSVRKGKAQQGVALPRDIA